MIVIILLVIIAIFVMNLLFIQGVGKCKTDEDRVQEDEAQMHYLKEWREKHLKEKPMQIEIKANITYDNIDKPDQPFTDSEWAETLKEFLEADDVEIKEVNYWDVTDDDYSVNWD